MWYLIVSIPDLCTLTLNNNHFFVLTFDDISMYTTGIQFLNQFLYQMSIWKGHKVPRLGQNVNMSISNISSGYLLVSFPDSRYHIYKQFYQLQYVLITIIIFFKSHAPHHMTEGRCWCIYLTRPRDKSSSFRINLHISQPKQMVCVLYLFWSPWSCLG